MLLGASFYKDVPLMEFIPIPCIYSHARWSYRRRFRSLSLCPLSAERYHFPFVYFLIPVPTARAIPLENGTVTDRTNETAFGVAPNVPWHMK